MSYAHGDQWVASSKDETKLTFLNYKMLSLKCIGADTCFRLNPTDKTSTT